MYTVKKVSQLSGVSIRTLHHYDKVGLFCPQKKENGYRLYTEDDLERLQVILFYKSLGFSLNDIKTLLNETQTNILSHLKYQYELMLQEKENLIYQLKTLKTTINHYERKEKMTLKERFEGFKKEHFESYQDEAISQYGKEQILKATHHQNTLIRKLNTLFFNFNVNLNQGLAPNETKNQALAKNLHETIKSYAFPCSLEAFAQIGEAYVKDERFKVNLNCFGEGTASYVSQAIAHYTKSQN